MTKLPKQPNQSPQGPARARNRESHAARSAGHRFDPVKGSPLDVEGIDLNLTSDEIVDLVREGRERRD